MHLLQLARRDRPRGAPWPRRPPPAGSIPADIDEEAVARRLYTAPWPDPDLLIRTSGEMRISNFLLWQLAYAELYVTPVLWPDFTRRHLFEAILEFQRRDRRFGRVSGLMDANLVRRVGFAVVAIPLALLIVWYGGLPLVLLLVAGRRARRRGSCSTSPSAQQVRPARALGLVSAAAIAPLAYAAIARRGIRVPWSTRRGPTRPRSG